MPRYWFRVCSSSGRLARLSALGRASFVRASFHLAPVRRSPRARFHRCARALPNVGLGNPNLRSRSFLRGIDALHLDAATHRSSPLTCTSRCSFCVHAACKRVLMRRLCGRRARWLVAAASEPPRRPADAVALGQYVGRLHVCRSSNVSTGFPLRRAQRDVVRKSPSIRSVPSRSRQRMSCRFARGGPRIVARGALCERGARQ